MEFYLFCLCLSFAGLVLMALMGLGHHGAGHARGHARTSSHVGARGKASAHRHGNQANSSRPNPALFLLGLFSPRVLFSVGLGFGATGTILGTLTHWPALWLVAPAALGGWSFERFLVGPFWNLLFGFASKPACTLESVALQAGKAATDFDRAGHGLVLLELDGQMRQVLGTLAPEERTADAPRIRTGEHLFIRSVDGRRNVCTVSRLGC